MVAREITLPIDGLTDREFEIRYAAVKMTRSQGQLTPQEMLAYVEHLASGGYIDLDKADKLKETEREFWDVGDWMKFLHGVRYKPGWTAGFTVGLDFRSTPLLKLDLRVSNDQTQNRIMGIQWHIHEDQVANDQDARNVLSHMISEAERSITEVWLKWPTT